MVAKIESINIQITSGVRKGGPIRIGWYDADGTIVIDGKVKYTFVVTSMSRVRAAKAALEKAQELIEDNL